MSTQPDYLKQFIIDLRLEEIKKKIDYERACDRGLYAKY